jgi:hypothetical protein
MLPQWDSSMLRSPLDWNNPLDINTIFDIN